MLEFMAANMLSVNPKKTEFLMVRPEQKLGNKSITIGNIAVQEVQHARLLGLKISKKLSGKEHTKEICTELNQRVGVLKRLGYEFSQKT